jgi:CDP-6-deoxy-D-xylo-4-hexulose-3-dehydrase
MAKISQDILYNIAKKSLRKEPFVPGETYIPVTRKKFDEEELVKGMEAVLDGWWTEGRFVEEFEREFKDVCGCRYVTLVKSGSSAKINK